MRYLATELGPRASASIAVSPGPLRRARPRGIAQFDELIAMAVTRSPVPRLVEIAEVGRVVRLSRWRRGRGP